MVTDEQYQDLLRKFNELSAKYSQLSKDIASIRMVLDIVKTQKGLEQPRSHKDVTRYCFMGKQYNKRNLVLHCIKQYISDSGTSNSKLLLETFPDYIQGPLGVIRSIKDAERYSGSATRYFFKDDDILHLEDGMFVISKDWTANNINRFITVFKELGYEIDSIIR